MRPDHWHEYFRPASAIRIEANILMGGWGPERNQLDRNPTVERFSEARSTVYHRWEKHFPKTAGSMVWIAPSFVVVFKGPPTCRSTLRRRTPWGDLRHKSLIV